MREGMMKRLLFYAIGLLLLTGCNKFDIEQSTIVNPDKEAINENAKAILGNIDPNQDWTITTTSYLNITADAPLHNIAKVQILTESPFFMSETAKVLAEAEVRKGGNVTLEFEAPKAYSTLVAACLDANGNYYIKPFSPDDSEVSFTTTANSPAKARRAATTTYPDVKYLKLESKNAVLSYNAQRARVANEAAASEDADFKATIKNAHIDLWENSGWDNEWLWGANNTGTGTDWSVVNMTLVRTIDDMTENERNTLSTVFEEFLKTEDVSATWKRKNNMEIIRNSDAVNFYNNELTSDGTTPITITPIFMPSGEIGNCHLYYYYYNPSNIPSNMTEDEFIKTLPKIKAIQCWHTRAAANQKGYGTNDLFKVHEYMLPYYGDLTDFQTETANTKECVSLAIPNGYRIGFMLRKLGGSQSTSNYDNIKAVKNGCCYSFGKLNQQINNFPGHFGSSTSTFTMEEDDPRTCYFTANGKTYIGFEDGCDCQFNDIIIEVGGYDSNVVTEDPNYEEAEPSGIETDYIYSNEEVAGVPYTMCFEDRPLTADYDLNDVVLRCVRKDATTITLSLVACGGNDNVVIHDATGWAYNNMEVHEAFGMTETSGDRMINTQENGIEMDVVSADVTIPSDMTIPQYLMGISIENKSTGKVIQVAKKGEAPFAIIIPQDFNYPKERGSITKAYPYFKQWVQNAQEATDWYMTHEDNEVYPNPFNN